MEGTMDYYKQILKRKSFHIFKNPGVITDDEMQRLNDFLHIVKPLNTEIKTEIHINEADSSVSCFTVNPKMNICEISGI